jgi:Homeodomain-like domain
MARVGSNKSPILQARVIELSAQGMSGRRIAADLQINRRTVARILAGPDARRIALEARERARDLLGKADAALHKSLDRGSSRAAIAVLRGAGVFERRSETIERHALEKEWREQDALGESQRRLYREVHLKFRRDLGPEPSPKEWERENARLDRLALIAQERALNSQS